jgi:hypothetical protein
MAAATLSSATVTGTGRHTATLSVATNQATGTVYAVITASATTPSHAEIAAGTGVSGALALWSGSAPAALTTTFAADSITALPGKLYMHVTQTNAGAENSTPISSAGFKLVSTNYGTLTANGDTDIVEVPSYPYIRASGTFGSGTITFSYQAGDGSWIALPSGALNAAGQIVPLFARPVRIRGTLAGSTNPTLAWEIR